MDEEQDVGDPVLTAAQHILKHTPGSEDSMAIQAVVCIVGIGEDGEK